MHCREAVQDSTLACVVLAHCGDAVQDSSVSQHCLQSQHTAVKGSISQQSESSSIGRHIAPYLTARINKEMSQWGESSFVLYYH